MPPAGELPLDVGPAQPAVGLNGEVSQVPVDRVHGTLPLGGWLSTARGPSGM
jgi:hypothetical protein